MVGKVGWHQRTSTREQGTREQHPGLSPVESPIGNGLCFWVEFRKQDFQVVCGKAKRDGSFGRIGSE